MDTGLLIIQKQDNPYLIAILAILSLILSLITVIFCDYVWTRYKTASRQLQVYSQVEAVEEPFPQV